MNLLEHKNKIALVTSLLLLIILISGAFFILSLGNNQTYEVNNSAARIIALQQFQNLDIKAKAYIVYDATNKQIVYAKNETAQLPLASLTKIMSAVVALDIATKDTIIEVTPNSSFNPNDRNALMPGKWKLGDLLRLTLVASSNSGINTISDELSTIQNFLGGEKHFLELMNTKAVALGLHQTYFLNESGLDVDSSLAGGYGSPIDVAKLFDFAVAKDPDIFGATRYDSIMINSTDGTTERALNTNNTVSQIRGLVSSKTGFTDLAQGNLAIAFDIDQKTRVIVVVLGSTQDGRFTATGQLTRASLAYYSLIK